MAGKETVYRHIPEIKDFLNKKKDVLPLFLYDSINALGEEEINFAANELAAVAEDIIFFLAGTAVAAYFDLGNSDVEIDDDLLRLFTGRMELRGGPMIGLSRKIAAYLEVDRVNPGAVHAVNIINDPKMADFDGDLSRGLNFRNNLKHGTFLAPAGKVREMADLLIKVLERVFSDDAPKLHVREERAYIGELSLSPMFVVAENGGVELKESWSLMDLAVDGERAGLKRQMEELFTSAESFIDLYLDYLDEVQGRFIEEEVKYINKAATGAATELTEMADEIYSQFQKHDSFSYGVNYPHGFDGNSLWAGVAKKFMEDSGCLAVPYRLRRGENIRGIRHTIDVLMGAVIDVVRKELGGSFRDASNREKESLEGRAENLKSNIDKLDRGRKVVAVIGGYHSRFFHPEHIRYYTNIIASCGISFIAFCHGYPELDSSFVEKHRIGYIEGDVIQKGDIDRLIDFYLEDQSADAEYREIFSGTVNLLWEILLSGKLAAMPGFRKEEFVRLRRLHDYGGTPLSEHSLSLVERAASALAPLLVFRNNKPKMLDQDKWFDLRLLPNEEGGVKKELTDGPVKFFQNFEDFSDFTKFDPADRSYRMFRNSVHIDRPETEADMIYDTLGRDDLHIEFSPVAVRVNDRSVANGI